MLYWFLVAVYVVVCLVLLLATDHAWQTPVHFTELRAETAGLFRHRPTAFACKWQEMLRIAAAGDMPREPLAFRTSLLIGCGSGFVADGQIGGACVVANRGRAVSDVLRRRQNDILCPARHGVAAIALRRGTGCAGLRQGLRSIGQIPCGTAGGEDCGG